MDRVEVVPPSDTIQVGATVQLAATTFAAGGAQLTGRAITWSSSNSNIASVSTSGLVTGVGPGDATITARSEGKSDISEITVEPGDLAPTGDTNLSGVLRFRDVNIPAGVTITATGALTLEVDRDLTIAGTLEGECVDLTIDGGGDIIITGEVSNACTLGQTTLPDMEITGTGELVLDGGMIEYAGNALIRNDPDLDEGDFLVPGPISGTPGALGVTGPQATSGSRDCRANNFAFVPMPSQAPSGANGQTGERGDDAKTWRLLCLGNATLAGDVRVFAQDGGPGGSGAHTSTDMAVAKGGDGGTGGLIRLLSVGSWTFTGGGNQAVGGDGGIGGFSEATGEFNADREPDAPGAMSTSGNGGMGGVIEVRSLQSITIDPGGLELVVGNGGFVANAVANGARGANASERTGKPAQKGGDALATGGMGGSSQEKTFQSSGAIAGLANLTTSGGNGGDGGLAIANAGNGGEGDTEVFKTGAPGGDISTPVPGPAQRSAFSSSRGDGSAWPMGTMTDRDPGALGGDGGNAQTTDKNGDITGVGGVGGGAQVSGGNGGGGFDGCAAPPAPPTQPGGNGGPGGKIGARDGEGGYKGLGPPPGAQTVSAGISVLGPVGNGGPGRDGWNTAGTGGAAGTPDIVPIGDRHDTDPQFTIGANGALCPPPGFAIVFLNQLATALIQTGGVIPPGLQELQFVNDLVEQVGSIFASFFGTNFVGLTPPHRYGTSPGSSIVLETSTATVDGNPFTATGLGFCLTGPVSPTNPAIVRFFTALDEFLGEVAVTSLTTAPPGLAPLPTMGGANCFGGPVPSGTGRIQFLTGGPFAIDFGGPPMYAGMFLEGIVDQLEESEDGDGR